MLALVVFAVLARKREKLDSLRAAHGRTTPTCAGFVMLALVDFALVVRRREELDSLRAAHGRGIKRIGCFIDARLSPGHRPDDLFVAPTVPAASRATI